MISSLVIENFKGFEKLEMPRLSKVTLIGGQNNVGKTTVLEALFMLFDRLNPQMILRQNSWRGIGALPVDPTAMWAPIFLDYDMEREIVIAATINGSEERMALKFNPNFVAQSIKAQESSDGGTPMVKTDQKPVPSFALDIRVMNAQGGDQVSHLVIDSRGVGLHIDYAVAIPYDAAMLGARFPVSSREDVTRFGSLDVIGKQSVITEFLQLIEPRLIALSSVTLGDTTSIYGDIGMSRKIPVSYMGDGMARLLSIVLAIATTRNGFVFIDEFENGLHHSVMAKVWEGIAKAANEFNCQVIATTHSYECLQAAHEGLAGTFERDFTYVRLDRVQNKVTAKTFDYELLGASLDAHMEVR